MVTMTPSEAITLLDNAAALCHGTRQDHYNVQVAVKVLREALAPKTGQAAPAESSAKQE